MEMLGQGFLDWHRAGTLPNSMIRTQLPDPALSTVSTLVICPSVDMRSLSWTQPYAGSLQFSTALLNCAEGRVWRHRNHHWRMCGMNTLRSQQCRRINHRNSRSRKLQEGNAISEGKQPSSHFDQGILGLSAYTNGVSSVAGSRTLFSCSPCNYGSRNRRDVQRHVDVRNGKKQQCPRCGKVVSPRDDNLTRHMASRSCKPRRR